MIDIKTFIIDFKYCTTVHKTRQQKNTFKKKIPPLSPTHIKITLRVLKITVCQSKFNLLQKISTVNNS